MSNGILGGSGFKQMGLGGGGENPRRQLILAIVLGVVVVGTIAMILKQTVGKGGGGGKLKGTITFHCMECEEMTQIKAKDAKTGGEVGAAFVVDCDQCGAENAAGFAIPCIKCGKGFARNNDKYMYEYWKENDYWPMRPDMAAMAEMGDEIRPHCGANNSQQAPDEQDFEEEYEEEEDY